MQQGLSEYDELDVGESTGGRPPMYNTGADTASHQIIKGLT